MFEDRKAQYYARAKDGKMMVTSGKGESKQVAEHDYLVGKITSIKYGESTYNNELIKSWRVAMKGEETSAILTLSYSSGFTRGLINSLCNAELSKTIKIGCYVNAAGYNSPSVIQDEAIVKWKYNEMPKTKKVQVGSKEVIDDEDAVKWTIERVAEINKSLEGGAEEVFKDEIQPDDLPF